METRIIVVIVVAVIILRIAYLVWKAGKDLNEFVANLEELPDYDHSDHLFPKP